MGEADRDNPDLWAVVIVRFQENPSGAGKVKKGPDCVKTQARSQLTQY
jgi:hypothetical protein